MEFLVAREKRRLKASKTSLQSLKFIAIGLLFESINVSLFLRPEADAALCVVNRSDAPLGPFRQQLGERPQAPLVVRRRPSDRRDGAKISAGCDIHCAVLVG